MVGMGCIPLDLLGPGVLGVFEFLEGGRIHHEALCESFWCVIITHCFILTHQNGTHVILTQLWGNQPLPNKCT
jgi:hypothetical protein